MFKSQKTKTASRLADATYVVIEWTERGGLAFVLTVKGSKRTTTASWSWTWPDGQSPLSAAEDAGKWLRQQLDARDIKTTNAIVSMPSRHACLRMLKLPNVPEDEQRQLIALQAESLQTGAEGDVVYDFQRIPTSVESQETSIVLSSIKPEVHEATCRMCQAADLKLKASGVGALELDALSPVKNHGATLNIHRDDSTAFLMLSQNGTPVRAIAIAGGDETATAQRAASSAARLQASLNDSPSGEIERVCMFGDVSITLHEQMSVAFPRCDVHVVSTDDANSVQGHALVAALSNNDSGFDFVSPRHSRNDHKQRWAKYTRLAAGATVLCGLLLLWNYDQHRQYSQQFAQLNDAAERQQELNDRGQALVNRWQYVSEWQSSSVDWTKEVRELADHFPPAGEGYLTRLQLEQSTESDEPLVRVDGLVTNSDVAMKLNRDMMDSGKYTLRPQGIEPAPHDSDFHSSYRIEASVTAE